MQCTQCQAEFQDGAKFCPHCGHFAAPGVATALFCADCQTPLKPGAKFCNHCGATVAAPEPAPIRQAAPPTPEPAKPVIAPPVPEPMPAAESGPSAGAQATPVSGAAPASQAEENKGNHPLPPLFPTEPATTMGNKIGLWIGLAIAFFAAIGAAVYLFMDNSPSPLKNKVGPMDVPAVSAPATPAQQAPIAPSSTAVPAVQEEAAPAVVSIPSAPQPAVVPNVPLPESAQAPKAPEPQPVKRPTNQPKPVVRPAPQPAPQAEPAPVPIPTPAPVATGKSCSQAGLLMRPICLVEGPATFWKCTPDGKRWDNNIPGCHRNNEN